MSNASRRQSGERAGCWVGCVLLLLLAGGCDPGAPLPQAQPPQFLSVLSVEPWPYGGASARQVQTEHYRIFTTVEDPELFDRLPRVLEAAHTQYQSLLPKPAVSADPLECYIFASRAEYNLFTRETTGADSETYLKIRRGGYTINDRFVTFFAGPQGTLSVAAHEGWHQFCARHMAARLPPFLEEGLACMFESVQWVDDQPQWDLRKNAVRLTSLQQAMENRELVPLKRLVAMHAGQAVEKSRQSTDAFYAQSWAFAHFLWYGQNGKHRAALGRWVADCVSGNLPLAPEVTAGATTRPVHRIDAQKSAALLRHYLGMDLARLEAAYMSHVRKLAGGASFAGE